MKITISCLLLTFLIVSEAMASSSSLLEDKIINGVPSVPRTMRFMASLRINDKHFCGGCLISKAHVLTAGQCVHVMNFESGGYFMNSTVLLGTTRIFGIGVTRNVKDAEYHPNFSPSNPTVTCSFDIGVVLLDKIILETDLVTEIAYSDLKCGNNMIAQIIGWGSEKFVQPNIPLNAVNMSLVLKKMTVKIISYTVCKHFYKNLVFDKEIIACGDGFHETATSKGDVGNPLIKNNKLLGITIQVSTSAPLLIPTLIIKVNMLKNYIKEAQTRLIKNQRRNPDECDVEQCLEDKIKRWKTDNPH